MRKFATATVLTLGIATWGCSGSNYSSGSTTSPAAPTPMNANGGGGVTIDVVAINGAQSFSPNPATLPAGQMVVWRNVDFTTHRVVLNDRSENTGNLAPGASSQPSAIGASSGQYHCSIHPEMIGSINQDTSTSPQGPGC
jgi:plastocyanin